MKMGVGVGTMDGGGKRVGNADGASRDAEAEANPDAHEIDEPVISLHQDEHADDPTVAQGEDALKGDAKRSKAKKRKQKRKQKRDVPGEGVDGSRSQSDVKHADSRSAKTIGMHERAAQEGTDASHCGNDQACKEASPGIASPSLRGLLVVLVQLLFLSSNLDLSDNSWCDSDVTCEAICTTGGVP